MNTPTYTREEQRVHRLELIEALLSGKYPAARRRLNNRHGYCCLGVACDISGLGEWAPANESGVDLPPCELGSQVYLIDGRCFDPDDYQAPMYPPVKVWDDYYGFTSQRGTLTAYGSGQVGVCSLAGMNDTGRSQVEIAEAIAKGYVEIQE